MTAVSIENLRVSFGKTDAVREASWVANPGEITAIMGPNGAGKTTTLKVVAGLIRPTAGRASVFGLPPRSRELRPRVGVMLPEGGFYPSATALRSLTLLAAQYAHPHPVAFVCDLVGLKTLRTPYRRMSSGEQRRLALAAALIGRPELVIADEPTSGLDPAARHQMWEMFASLREHGVTVLLTTHYAEEAERLADRVVVYRAGCVVAQGTLAELLHGDDVMTFSASSSADIGLLEAALPLGVHVKRTAVGRYCVQPASDPAVVATVTAWCAQHALTTRELSVGRRSLEDLVLGASSDE